MSAVTVLAHVAKLARLADRALAVSEDLKECLAGEDLDGGRDCVVELQGITDEMDALTGAQPAGAQPTGQEVPR